jgi:hypothetical protein
MHSKNKLFKISILFFKNIFFGKLIDFQIKCKMVAVWLLEKDAHQLLYSQFVD